MRLTVKVIPGAAGTGAAGWSGDVWRVRVSAPPEKGRANRALLNLVADRLGLPVSALRIVRGETRELKVLEIEGRSRAEILARLDAPDGNR